MDQSVDTLRSRDFTEAEEPFGLFQAWLRDAEASEPNDPNGMALATVDADGLPDCRMVLLKGQDERGFVFYTNRESAKGAQLAGTMKAAILIHWKTLRRQIRIRGPVSQVTDAESDAYYMSRGRHSRIGAWASQQSRPLDSRATLEETVARFDAEHPGDTIPRPPYWVGFRVSPLAIEFWQDGEHRLHDRVRFTRDGEGWGRVLLYP